MISESLQAELREAFALESSELLVRLGAAMLELEHQNPEAQNAALHDMMRVLHTLKGSSRVVDLHNVSSICHELESMVNALASGARALDNVVMDSMNQAIWLVEKICAGGDDHELSDILALLAGARAPQDAGTRATTTPTAELRQDEDVTALPGPSATTAGPSATTAGPSPGPTTATTNDSSIRVTIAKLDNLHASVSELVVLRLQEAAMLKKIARLRADFLEVESHWRALQSDLREHRHKGTARTWFRLESSTSNVATRLKATSRAMFQLSGYATGYTGRLSTIAESLEDGLKRIRVMPVGPYLQSFYRVLRDAARAMGKKVRLEVTDRNIELDRHALERLREPLGHLLRNAVAHGIESPDERLAVGKDAVGSIRLEADSHGEIVRIRVIDDGRGIDRMKLLGHGGRLSELSEPSEPSEPSEASGPWADQSLLELLCSDGFSTSHGLDAVSGRGIGLAIVRQALQEIDATLALETDVGRGTEFILSVPVNLATVDTAIVQVGPYRFGVPLRNIERAIPVRAADVRRVQSSDVIFVDGDAIALTSLAQLLRCPEHAPRLTRSALPTLILESDDRRLAVTVDDVVDEMPMVIKPIGAQFEHISQFAGGAIQADGSVLIVLDPRHCMAADTRAQLPAADVGENDRPGLFASQLVQQKTILVVDDSITTRTMERNILEAAGYLVHVAIDGQEAFDLLHMLPVAVDLVITDLHMPRVSGATLCRRIRESVGFSQLPIIIVTSVDHGKDMEEGMQAGADAYIVKSEFDQDQLLETVRRFLP